MRHYPSISLVLLAFIVTIFGSEPAGACTFAAQQWGSVLPQANPGSIASDEIRLINSTVGVVVKDFEPIANRSDESRFREYAAPVGRVELLYEQSDGQICVDYCTGFLVTANHFVTAAHCITSPAIKRIEALKFRLGLISKSRAGVLFDVNANPVEASAALDYVILEAQGRPGDQFGTVNLEPIEIVAGSDLIIIGYPLGQPQQFSTLGCTASAQPPVLDTEFRHTCQTGPGNSGSPIFDDRTGSVIAIHQRGPGQIAQVAELNTGSYRIALALNAIMKESSILQSVSKGTPLVALQGFGGYHLELTIARGGRLLCKYRTPVGGNPDSICPLALPFAATRSIYMVKGTAVAPDGTKFQISGTVPVREDQGAVGCELLISRVKTDTARTPAVVSAVCG